MKAAAKKPNLAIQTKPLPIGGNMLALESRYVFDAALGREINDLIVNSADSAGDLQNAPATTSDARAALQSYVSNYLPEPTIENSEQHANVLLEAMIEAHNLAPWNREVAFIDSRVADIATLVSAIPEGTRIVLIDASRDGVAQMVDALRGEQGISGIHILSHGSEGSISLGASTINADSMQTVYRSALASMGSNLSADADILVYGCNFAAGDRGAAAVGLLASLTGADVAASEDLTGGAARADWNLEVATGAVEADAIEAAAWAHELVEISIQDGSGSGVRNQPLSGTLAGLASAINPTAPVAFTAGTFATTNGSVTIQSDGSFVYTPNAGYLGSDAFQFEASAIDPNDGFIVYATAIYAIQVDPDPNYVITTTNESNTVGYQNPGNTIVFNGTVADNVTPSPLGGPITSYVLTQGTSNGTLTFNADGTYSYQPNANYSGSDSFVVRVNDADPNSDPAFVTVYLNVSGPPLDAYGYSTYVAPDAQVTVTPGQYEADPLATFTYTAGTSPDGTVVNNGDGSFTFIPNAGYTGTTSFNYTVTDSNGYVSTDTVWLVYGIQAGGGGIAPLEAYADTQWVMNGTTLYNNANYYAGNSNGAAPVYSLVVDVAPTHGTLTSFDPASGNYTYEPTAGYVGPDSFTFTVTDQYGQTATATETINIYPPTISTTPRVHFAPIGQPVSDTFGNRTWEPVNQTTEVFYVNGAPISNGQVIATAHGSLTITNAATGAYTWQPNAGFAGPEVINWSVRNYWGAGPNDYYETDASTDTIISPNRTYAGHRGYAIEQGTSQTGSLTAFSGSPSGTPSYQMLWGGTNGTATVDASGNYSYTPNAGFLGIDRFGYEVQNGLGQSATNYITILVTGPRTPGNLDPVATAIPDRVNVDSDAVTGINVASFFSDPESDPLTFVADGLPPGLTMDAAGNITGTIDNRGSQGGFGGQYEVSVFALDDRGGVVQQTFLWNVTNPAPDAVNDAVSTPYMTPVVVNLLANDTDPDNDPLTVTAATLVDPTQGTLTDVGGVWTFTPTAGFSGSVLINYTITDQDGSTDTAQHTITVSPNTNLPPVLVDPDTTPGTPFVDPANPANLIIPAVDAVPGTVDLTTYYSDPNGDPRTVTPDLSALPPGWTVSINAGVLTYTAPVDNAGSITIPVTVTDGQGGTFTGTITITPTNPGPDAVNDATTTAFNTPVVVNLLANDTDPDNDPLTVTAATLVDPTQGTLTDVGGVWTFTPTAGFSGSVLINYTITDQDGSTDTAQHTITVSPNTNLPPVLVDPDLTPGTPFVDPANPANLVVPVADATPGSLDLDLYFGDPNGDPRTIVPDLSSLPPGWTVSFNPGTGVLSYTAPADNGVPITLPVTVTDGNGGTFTGTVSLVPTNPGPDAVNDGTSTTFNTPVTVALIANDTDPDGDPLTVTSATVPAAQGTIAFDGTDWVFTPATGFTGTATITYTIQDQDGATDTAQHTVTIGAPAMPVAVNDYYTTPYATAMGGDVRTGDTFAPGSTFMAMSQPMNGTLSFNADGSYTYTPAAGFVGTETFIYQVRDPAGQTALAIEIIRVAPPALVAVNDAYTTPFNTAVNGNASLNDTFAVGSTFIAITSPSNGTLAFNADGSYVYTPRVGFVGVDMFAYAVTDTLGQTRFATDTITVQGPLAPVAVDDAYSTGYMTPVTGNAATGDTYLPGATFAMTSAPTHGTVVFNPDGSYSYTPAAGFAGTDTFTYQVTDPSGQTATATETITVTPPALVAVDDAYTGIYGLPVNGNAATADTFASGSTFDVATLPANGSVTMNTDGTYTYTPAAGFTGTDTFTYRVTDPTGQTVLATETIVITPPTLIAVDDSYVTAFNTPVDGNAATADTFAPGSTFTVAAAPSVGSVAMNADGTYRYVPPGNFAGTVSFTYRVTDPTGLSVTATETIVVSPPALIAVSDTYLTPYNTPLNGNAALGDTYAPGSAFAATSSPSHGTVTMNADGTYRYLPRTGFVGTDTFTYSVTDPTGQTVTATETITITAPPPAVHRCITTFGNLSLRRR